MSKRAEVAREQEGQGSRRAEVAKIRGQGGRQEAIRGRDKETRNRQEVRTSGTLAGKLNNG